MGHSCQKGTVSVGTSVLLTGPTGVLEDRSLPFFVLASLSLFPFEKPAAVAADAVSGKKRTSKYRCKVERTSSTPCGYAR